MMLKLLAAATMVFAASAAQAQDWRQASTGSTDGSMFFIDADSVGKPKPISSGKAFLLLRESEEGISAIAIDLEFECATGRRRVKTMLAYDDSDQPLQPFDGDGAWEETPTDTQFGALLGIICGKDPMPGPSLGSAVPFAAGRKLMSRR